MFKKLLKSRHDRNTIVSQPVSVEAVYSPLPHSNVYSPMTHGGVEYPQSPPVEGYEIQSTMPGPVQYAQSPPVAQPGPLQAFFQNPVSSGPAVEYNASGPSLTTNRGTKNGVSTTSMGPAVEYNASEPSIPAQNPTYTYAPYSHPSAAELPDNTAQRHPSQAHELSASPAPQRNELPVPRARIIPPTLSTTGSASPNTMWTGASSYATPASTPAISPPPPYLPQQARFPSPNPAQQNRPPIPSPVESAAKTPPSQSEQDAANGIIKFTLNIFCQRKAPDTGGQREEIPRDVREFRLAKVALIPVAAGERRFVSLDVVFGEVDKGVAGILEKHYFLTPESRIERFSGGGIGQDAKVWRIQPVKVAYKGYASLLYLTFRNTREETKFRADFEKMKTFSEAC